MTTHLEMAKSAIDQVRNIQSANTWGAKITDYVGATNYGASVALTQAQQGPVMYGGAIDQAYADVVQNTGYGNCSDKARVALRYLDATYHGEASFTYCGSTAFDHAFVIIHSQRNLVFAQGSNLDRSAFGDDAVVADAWQHDYYKLNGYPSTSLSAWFVGPSQSYTRLNVFKGRIHPMNGTFIAPPAVVVIP